MKQDKKKSKKKGLLEFLKNLWVHLNYFKSNSTLKSEEQKIEANVGDLGKLLDTVKYMANSNKKDNPLTKNKHKQSPMAKQKIATSD